ncbi:hypothetical protein BKA57DRAFT_299020 [Linnemannia elongata]|nr:hypothetical protein BGZ88_004026 [Linnemannia elongata]KAH7051899.1 hypothetical protein BKA57DRAFT_299020 [Linnemannia elongata]
MVHNFVCDDFAYEVIPITLLNETDRTAEPDFKITCQSDDCWLPFIILLLFLLGCSYLFVINNPDFIENLKQRMSSIYAWITTVLCNIFISIRNLFIRRNPAKYWPLPTSQTSEETARGSALLPFHTTRASSVDDPPSYLGDGASETTTVHEQN